MRVLLQRSMTIIRARLTMDCALTAVRLCIAVATCVTATRDTGSHQTTTSPAPVRLRITPSEFRSLLEINHDQLFSKTLNNSTYTLHILFPPQSTASQHYHLRRRTHTNQSSAVYKNCNERCIKTVTEFSRTHSVCFRFF